MLKSLNTCLRYSRGPTIWRRYRSSTTPQGFLPDHPHEPRPTVKSRPIHKSIPRPSHPLHKEPPSIVPGNEVSYFESNVKQWANNSATLQRLESFGIPPSEGSILLDLFDEQVSEGRLSDQKSYQLSRFSSPHDNTSLDVIYSTTFFTWVSNFDTAELLDRSISSTTISTVRRLVEATSCRFPADGFPAARAMHRKIIMHVGPTNSGKTHHALRALAAAKSGVYAGPLRLLAHEIWERLNTGQIVPLGVEQPPPDPSAPKSMGDPAYARACNMITGEEQRIVGDNVMLLSCTVEMLGFTQPYDVGVIDEIQMIGDIERGGGWTNAVLGLCARELHLCGEETAVPVVRSLLQDTGDEIEIRRYERLTPLIVEESLDGDLGKVRKGDCIVTFKRSNIFGIKRLVEQKTGMRCAVVYGRLPPEVRSEQAALFNDPDSGYDVIIGSDAIGMGLNLKIKRVVFESTSKFSGNTHKPLSISSVKQIAGRAGRYGLHTNPDDVGGYTTTLHASDLPYLQKCVNTPFSPLPFARISAAREDVPTLMEILPPASSIDTVLAAHRYISPLPPYMRYTSKDHLQAACRYIDSMWSDMCVEDKGLLLYAPVPWKDPETVWAIRRLLDAQMREGQVGFGKKVMALSSYMDCVKWVEGLMKEEQSQTPAQTGEDLDSDTAVRTRPQTPNVQTLQTLESFHKVIVFYIWMSFRNPVVYAGYDEAQSLKHRLETVLNWCLEGLGRKMKTWQRDEAKMARPVQQWRSRNSPREDVQRKSVLTPKAACIDKMGSEVLGALDRMIELDKRGGARSGLVSHGLRKR